MYINSGTAKEVTPLECEVPAIHYPACINGKYYDIG